MDFNKYSKERQANFLKMFSLLQEVAKLDELTDEAVAMGEGLVEEIYNTGFAEGFHSATIYADRYNEPHEPYMDYHIRPGQQIPDSYCREVFRKNDL